MMFSDHITAAILACGLWTVADSLGRECWSEDVHWLQTLSAYTLSNLFRSGSLYLAGVVFGAWECFWR
jgi:hypothetical protein